MSIASEPFTNDSSALSAAVNWIGELLIGGLGTSIAVIAIAWVGVTLLQGRMLVRDSLRIILGCFILFGAPVIAKGFMDIMRSNRDAAPIKLSVQSPPIPLPAKPPQFDPYAGASMPHQ